MADQQISPAVSDSRPAGQHRKMAEPGSARR
jgi:hypothetical protein